MKRLAWTLILALPTAAIAAEEPKADSVTVDFGAEVEGTDGAATASEVVVTGVGLDPEKAEQNAFARAIEQTVGMLVDAESIVENDELVKEEILTFSRGYVREFRVLRRWQDADGLHHADIYARVAVGELYERLKAPELAIVPVDGPLEWNQTLHEMENERNAAEMIHRALRDLQMPLLVKAKTDGKPKNIGRQGVMVKWRVSIVLTADMEAWTKLHGNLKPILDTVAKKKGEFSTELQGQKRDGLWYDFRVSRQQADALCLQLTGQRLRLARHMATIDFAPTLALAKNPGKARIAPGSLDQVFVYVLREISPGGGQAVWDAYLLPSAVILESLGEAQQHEHQLTVRLLGEDGQTLVQHAQPLMPTLANVGSESLMTTAGMGQTYLLAPLFFHSHGQFGDNVGDRYAREYRMEVDLLVGLNTLRDLTDFAVAIDEAEGQLAPRRGSPRVPAGRFGSPTGTGRGSGAATRKSGRGRRD